ncbi:MAG: hypothetical protein HY001_04885 [Candidatus Portnoybacteria bacterium]|nr:hypothetical protein [Candidatus Portnoybacteria bacterium]
MEIKQALKEVREVFRAAPLGFRWYGSKEYQQLFDMEPSEALAVAEAAVREMQQKRSLDEGSYFALGNELNEKVFIYNLLLQAIEQGGEVTLTDEDIAHFREKTANCVLMDYAAYVADLIECVTNGKERRLPKGVRGFSF